jgi:HSP20 family protein
MNLPNMRKEDVSIHIRDNQLIVSGNTDMQTDVEDDGFVMRESRRGRFSRSILLPSGTRVSSGSDAAFILYDY